jgi:hypothetical protein
METERAKKSNFFDTSRKLMKTNYVQANPSSGKLIFDKKVGKFVFAEKDTSISHRNFKLHQNQKAMKFAQKLE